MVPVSFNHPLGCVFVRGVLGGSSRVVKRGNVVEKEYTYLTVMLEDPVLKYYQIPKPLISPSHPLSRHIAIGATHTLRSHNLIIVRAQRQARRGPSREVIRDRDGAAGALGLPHAPVLVEGRRARDAGLVDALRAVDVVRAAVGHDGAERGGARAGVVGPEVLDDVVLDQRAGRPAVDGEVRVAVGRVGA